MAFQFQGYDPNDQQSRFVTMTPPPPQAAPAQPPPNLYPDPESGAYPNAIGTPAAMGGQRLLEDWTDFIQNRQQAGIGWMPIQAPNIGFETQRDPNTGEYLSQTINPDFSGVPNVVRDMANVAIEPAQSRLDFGLGQMNAVRDRVIAAAQPTTYQTSRIVETLDPRTGFSSYQQVPETRFHPFLPLQSRFA